MAFCPQLTGKWRGTYAYGPRYGAAAGKFVAFELDLKQTLLGFFWGHVRDDPATGLMEQGKIRGRVSGNSIWFWKMMPVGRMVLDDGTTITMREMYVRTTGKPLAREIAAMPVRYDGNW